MTPPTKPPTTTDKRLLVNRGGGWSDNRAVWVRAADRYWITRAFRFATLGFRCAQRGVRQPLKVTP